MPYTIDDSEVQTITWDDNPNGHTTQAVITDGVVTSLQIEDQNGNNILYSLNTADLEHVKNTLTDLLNILAAP